MSLHEAASPVADVDSEDFGLARHLAAIELMHGEAVAQLELLVRPWARLWAARSDVQSCATEEFPAVAPPTGHGAHAEAA